MQPGVRALRRHPLIKAVPELLEVGLQLQLAKRPESGALMTDLRRRSRVLQAAVAALVRAAPDVTSRSQSNGHHCEECGGVLLDNHACRGHVCWLAIRFRLHI